MIQLCYEMYRNCGVLCEFMYLFTYCIEIISRCHNLVVFVLKVYSILIKMSYLNILQF